MGTRRSPTVELIASTAISIPLCPSVMSLDIGGILLSRYQAYGAAFTSFLPGGKMS